MTRILTIIALLFAAPVAADEILMDCQGAVFCPPLVLLGCSNYAPLNLPVGA